MSEAILELLFLMLFILAPLILEVMKKRKKSQRGEPPEKGLLATIFEELEKAGEEVAAEPDEIEMPYFEEQPPLILSGEEEVLFSPKPPLAEKLPAKAETRPDTVKEHQRVFAKKVVRFNKIDQLRKGIVWAEILLPPVSKRRARRAGELRHASQKL